MRRLEFSKSRLKMFNNYSSMDSHGFLLLQLKQYDEAIYYFNKAMHWKVSGIQECLAGWERPMRNQGIGKKRYK